MSVRTVDQERASIHMELGRMYEGYDELAELLDGLLRVHAHELAEEIRAETQAAKDVGVLEPDKFRPCRDAADQIDPEVT